VAERGGEVEALVKDLRRQVSVLEEDLRLRSAEVPVFDQALHAEYAQAYEAGRTAAGYQGWLADRVTQAAAAWVLATLFVRYCEDNALITAPFLAGPGDRLAEAEERHEEFFRAHPRLNDRDWLVEAFTHLAQSHPTVAGLFDQRHNPLWGLTPSFEAAAALVGFWRRRTDGGGVRWSFKHWDTRFLGDVYQSLSEHARSTYALLQTPEFVEEFILKLTLEPAIEEFGLDGFRVIDPACGSGHFLLGAFHHLVAAWRELDTTGDDWALIRRAARSVHGCDKNPFAASIARFRLLVEVLHTAGIKRLDTAQTFPINIAVGDSLFHGRGMAGEQLELGAPEQHTYRTEDVREYIGSCDMLDPGSYHAVVGNPPYITVKDKQENANYRVRWPACAGTYALSVPFAQRMFHLAVRAQGSQRRAGFVGQITANSFMKREFGKKLIEKFFPTVHLTHIIDTSGAYIPGHGTPTVILAGRNHPGRLDPVRAVLGIRGEPSQPADPAKGLVWSAIVNQYAQPGSESDWVTVSDLDRTTFAHHPWSVTGGGASEVMADLVAAAAAKLGKRVDEIGFGAVTREDDAYMVGAGTLRRTGIDGTQVRPLVEGEVLRDFVALEPVTSLWPYDEETLAASGGDAVDHLLWPYRAILRHRVAYGKTQLERGLEWFEYSMFFTKRYLRPLSIAFAFVATHNHFVLDRGGKVFNRTAPVIKLAEGATEDQHLELLGLLNSSAACFWLKQVCHNKGEGGGARVAAGYAARGNEEWKDTYEFTGTKLAEFPVPGRPPLELGRALDSLAKERDGFEPAAVCGAGVPTRERLRQAGERQGALRRRMVALQEELDWQVYGAYGLLSEAESAGLVAGERDAVPEVALGERAFEIVLARKVAAGEEETVWFERHGSTMVTEVPARWPEWYRQVVQARIETIERRRDLALIERPECKRRWAGESWAKRERAALRGWLLDRCEDRELWYALRDGERQPRPLTVHQLADQLGRDAEVNAVARLYATEHLGNPDLPLAQVLDGVLAEEHVPYLAALRYTDSGLRKRAEWEAVWEAQREEDRTGKELGIPVPPRYGKDDFRKGSYWTQRGKLDVPKERFVSFPAASPDADPSLLLGWAGWDHAERAQVLLNLVNDRTTVAGWPTERIVSLLAGLRELLPWLWQWHGAYDPEWQEVPARAYAAFLTEQREVRRLTEPDLAGWRPAAGGRRGARAGAGR
jgi:Domain of unknown function (DUF7008)/Eco57I restriction-modification methylase